MYLRVGVLVFLIALAGCLAAPVETTSGAAPASNATTIHVTGVGQASAEADLAVVAVSVQAQAATADGARSQVASDAAQMRAALRAAGVADEAVRTTSFRLFARYNTTAGERTVVGYTAVHDYRVETAPDRAGEIIDVAVDNGADQIDGVAFTLSEATRETLREAVLTEAVRTARTDAETIAMAANRSITGVEEITIGDAGGPTPELRFDEVRGSAGTTIEPGPVTVQARVQVTYTAA